MGELKISEPFWLDDPKILITKLDIIPNRKMTGNERLNAITRLIILITFIMFVIGYDKWYLIFLLGILLVLILQNVYHKETEGFGPHRGRKACQGCGFDSTMPYISTRYEETPSNTFSHVNYGLASYNRAKYNVVPMYVPSPASKVWQNEPHYCSEFTGYPDSYEIPPASSLYDGQQQQQHFNIPKRKCYWEDDIWFENSPTGQVPPANKVPAMPAIQSAFMRHSSTFRNNIMGDYIDQIERTRQHNCVGFKPGRKTF